MIKIGIQDRILDEGYFGSTPCDNCGKTEENSYVVWSKVFVMGPWFYPTRWFHWGKNANVTCNNCHRTLNISETKGYLRERLDTVFNSNKLWKKNILGYLVMLFLLYLLYFEIKMM